MKEQMTTHSEEIVPLKRIEGQIRGIQKMIEEKRYCIDMRGCVRDSLLKGNRADKEAKMNEVIGVLRNFRRY